MEREAKLTFHVDEPLSEPLTWSVNSSSRWTKTHSIFSICNQPAICSLIFSKASAVIVFALRFTAVCGSEHVWHEMCDPEMQPRKNWWGTSFSRCKTFENAEACWIKCHWMFYHKVSVKLLNTLSDLEIRFFLKHAARTSRYKMNKLQIVKNIFN